MTIALAGGSGFLGCALFRHLTDAGHRVVTLTRRPRPGVATDIAWTPDGSAAAWAEALEGIDALVNLAGEGLADRRWTATRKAAISDSRQLAVKSLASAIRTRRAKPRLFVAGSAIGYYGAHGDEIVTERTPPGADFLADLCVQWERASQAIASVDTSVAIVRTGLVLDPRGGALAKMLLPFKLGVGGRLGSGRQFMSWIHLEDWTRLVARLIESGDASGPFNLTAPTPVTNAAFTRALGRALNRPAFMPVPGLALRIVLGEMAAVLLTGARVVPARAEEMGFQFKFRELDSALGDLL